MRLRLELRTRLSPSDGLAIRSNTIIGSHLIGGNGGIRTTHKNFYRVRALVLRKQTYGQVWLFAMLCYHYITFPILMKHILDVRGLFIALIRLASSGTPSNHFAVPINDEYASLRWLITYLIVRHQSRRVWWSKFLFLRPKGGCRRSRTPSLLREPGFQGQSQDQPRCINTHYSFGATSRDRTWFNGCIFGRRSRNRT